jgi:hypothetical protein
MIPESNKKYRRARHPRDLYVAPNGTMKWTGTLPAPNQQLTDGPLPSLQRAQEWLRTHKTPGPITVWIRGGRYLLKEPLVFTGDDSGPITYAAYDGEEVIFDGGRQITGWTEHVVKGRRQWTTQVTGYFRQLWVNGRRATRPRFPKAGFFKMESVPETLREGFMAGPPSDVFYSAPGDVQPWANLTDCDVVAFHYWNEERLPIASFDPETRRVQCTRKSVWPLKDDVTPTYARYWVENVREALTEPGEWYLDRPTGVLTYLPLPDEKLKTAEIFAPGLPQLLHIRGAIGLTFRGIRFEHTEYFQPGDRGGHEQAALNVPGVITIENSRHITIEDCTVAHTGFYAIEINSGSQGIRVAGNTLTDLGAGGVKVVGETDQPPTGNCVISDNEIAEAGKVFMSAIGVLLVHTAGNDLVHNHIHHLEYSGVSCGWVWGYGANPTRDNLIAHNHIHHIGSGLLNDMGGVYLLGIQPGTILRGNLIHDVRMHNYGAWAIYADEGTSHVLFEGNVAYHCDSEIFQLHYGRENIVRNNVFAFSKLGLVSLTIAVEENAFTLEHNLLLTQGEPALIARDNETLTRRGFHSDLNLFWDTTGQKPHGADQQRDAAGVARVRQHYQFAELQKLGYDCHSLIADPKIKSWRKVAGKAAAGLGFLPLDLSGVGRRVPRE